MSAAAYGRNARLGDGVFMPSPFKVLRGVYL